MYINLQNIKKKIWIDTDNRQTCPTKDVIESPARYRDKWYQYDGN